MFQKNKKKNELVHGAIPTIFKSPDPSNHTIEIEQDVHDLFDSEFSQSVPPQENENSKTEIESLEREILRLQAQSAIEKQSMQMKIDSLSKKWEVVDIKCKVQSKRIAELEKMCKSKDSKQRSESGSTK